MMPVLDVLENIIIRLQKNEYTVYIRYIYTINKYLNTSLLPSTKDSCRGTIISSRVETLNLFLSKLTE